MDFLQISFLKRRTKVSPNVSRVFARILQRLQKQDRGETTMIYLGDLSERPKNELLASIRQLLTTIQLGTVDLNT